MNNLKNIKVIFSIVLALGFTFMPGIGYYSDRAQAQATNKVEAIDASPAGADLNQALKTALIGSHTDHIRLLINQQLSYRPLLKIHPKDIEHIKSGDIDRRILRSLHHLVTPRELGGAGYQYLKIGRIMKGYDTPISGRNVSREYPEGKSPNVSVHTKGQAYDILEVDYINSTLKSYKLTGASKKRQAPMPIKVAWQSEKGFEQSGGMEAYNQSLHGLFNEYGFDLFDQNMILELSDLYGIQIDLENYSINDLEDAAKILALGWFGASADMPNLNMTGLDVKNLSWENIIKEMGRSYLGDLLGLDPTGLKGKGFSEIRRNLGRAEVETRLSIPAWSFDTSSGKSSDILKKVATRHLEDDLELSPGTLTNIATDAKARKAFSNSIDQYKSNRASAALSLPTCDAGCIAVLKGTDKNATSLVLRAIGAHYLSQILAGNIAEQSLIYDWIQSKGSIKSSGNLKIDEARIAGGVGLKAGDIENIFIKDSAFAVFDRIGETVLLDGLEYAAFENFDPLAEHFQDVGFYIAQARNLKESLDGLKGDSDLGSTVNQVLAIVNDLRILTNDDLGDLEGDVRALNNVARILSSIDVENLSSDDLSSIREIESSLYSFIEGVGLPQVDNLGMNDLSLPSINIFGTDLKTEDIFDILLSEDPSQSITDLATVLINGQFGLAWGIDSKDIANLLRGEDVSASAESLLADVASSFFSDELGIELSGQDIQDIFGGKFDKLIDIGGAMLDDSLNLPKGSIADVVGDGADATEILERAGSLLIGQIFGINIPISLTGNFSENLGKETIKTRLGVVDFEYSSISEMVSDLGIDRVASMFHLDMGESNEINSAVIKNSSLGVKYINTLLGLPSDSDVTANFLLGGESSSFTAKVGDRAAIKLGSEAGLNLLIEKLGLDNNQQIKESLETAVDKLISGEKWNSADTPKLLSGLLELAGINLEETTGLTQAEIELVFEDSANLDEVISGAGMRILSTLLAEYAGIGQNDLFKYADDLINYFQNGENSADLEGLVRDVADELGINDDELVNVLFENGIEQGLTKELLTGLSSAVMTNLYNEEFAQNPLSYDDVRNAVTASPALVGQWLSDKGIDNPNQKQIDMAERESRSQAQRDLEYKIFDAQLHRLDESIPIGFSQTMFEGEEKDRREMLVSYVFDKFSGEIPSEITQIINPDDLKTAIINDDFEGLQDKLKTSVISFFEDKLSDLAGISFAPGTVDAFLNGDFKNAVDINRTLISRYMDGWLGLPGGTTDVIWSAYDAYSVALDTYEKALVGSSPEQIAEAKATFNGEVANIVITLVNFAFGKQFAKLDQNFGLPAGTTSAIVGLGITWAITGAIPAVGLLGLAYSVLFGTYKVRLRSTPCNYYPDLEDPPIWMKMRNPDNADQLGILPSAYPYCPGVWSYKPKYGSETFKEIAIASAQYKVAMLMGDLLYMNDVLEAKKDRIAGSDKNMLPIQLLTFREEDRNRYLHKIVKEYGKTAGERGASGVIISEKVWDVVHVGY